MIRVCETNNIIVALKPEETLVVPVAADYKLVGLAGKIRWVFPIERTLLNRGFRLCPDALYADGVIVLVGKQHTESTYQEWCLRKAIHFLRVVCEYEGIKNLAFQPFSDENISWYEIRKMLEEEFGPTYNITIYNRR